MPIAAAPAVSLHWSFDPVLLAIGPLSLRWYGALFVAAFWAGQAILARIFVAEGVARAHAERLLLYALLGTILGARLVHCLAYDPGFYFENPLEIVKIWKGGLASHGGAVGMLLGLWLYGRAAEPRLPFLWLVDRVSIPAALGAAFVRVANFLNSEIVGVPTSSRLGLVFDAVDGLPRHPVQLYEAACYLVIFGLLLALYRRTGKHTPHGMLFGLFLLLVFSARIALEFLKVPQAAYEAGQLFTVGQYLSAPFAVFGGFMIVWSRRASHAVK